MKYKVVIVYRFLPHYRVEFYHRLRRALSEEDVELVLVYGKSQGSKGDEVEISWARYRRNYRLSWRNYELLWQSCLSDLRGADLIIVEQANRLLLNYLLMLLRPLGLYQLAFWGHGLNRQADRRAWVNRFKERFICCSDWWFAYTRGVADLLRDCGYPRRRITVVENTIDMAALRAALDEAGPLPAKLAGRPMALFCGGMYAEKRLDFLLSCCHQIRRRVPDFQMVFVGSGPEREKVSRAARASDWVHDLGPLFGTEKATYLSGASVMLMPGLVGLVVLDCFAGQTPLVTTDFPYHSPEIEYLENESNGLVVKDEDFVDSVVALLQDRDRLDRLKEGCRWSAGHYSVDRMVENFASGIVACLDRSKTRPPT